MCVRMQSALFAKFLMCVLSCLYNHFLIIQNHIEPWNNRRDEFACVLHVLNVGQCCPFDGLDFACLWF